MPAFMTAADAARIQASQAKGGGDMSTHGFAARAQAAAAKNAGTSPSGGGKASSNTNASNTGRSAGQDKSANAGIKK